MKRYTIAVIPGDGIGDEVMNEAIKVLDAVARRYGYRLHRDELLVGEAAYQAYGSYFPKETIEGCKRSDAILLGATGVSTQRGRELILDIRKEFGFFANIRPIVGRAPQTEYNFVIVRELLGGIYFGRHKEADYKGLREDAVAKDTGAYSVREVERIAHVAFKLAGTRKRQLVSVDKANVLSTSRLWRKVVDDVAALYKDISYTHMFVDNAAMQMIKNPKQFDVIVTDNMFGDILSDEAAGLVGSLGMLPSASINEHNFALFEPIHGSAPDIAGKGIANPIGMILSAAMMMRYSFGLEQGAQTIEDAVDAVLGQGYATPDLKPQKEVGTKEFGELVVRNIR